MNNPPKADDDLIYERSNCDSLPIQVSQLISQT